MKTLKRLALAFFMLTPALALADVDYACFSQCVARGSNAPFCQRRCEYANPFSGGALERAARPVDQACLAQCVGATGNYAFCQQRCQ